MSELAVILIPAVLTTKQCHDYVGGRPLFEELLAKHGEILRPVRTTDRGDSYFRRTTVDAALAIAESGRTMISKTPIREKRCRRFQPA